MTLTAERIERLVVLLVKPTTYDDRGYPLRFWKGVLPSNSVAAMNGLTIDAAKQLGYSGDNLVIKVLDDAVWDQRIANPEKLVDEYDDGQTCIVVGLVGVQTNQFPRALDLTKRFQQAGATVVIGGFHVSGSIATLRDGISVIDPSRKGIPSPHQMPAEVTELMASGVIVCHGEAEEVWVEILDDILNGKPQALYEGGNPDLNDAPMPQYPDSYFDDFATGMWTVDSSRGCPFACKFCSIINVQGRTMRFRNPGMILKNVRQMCKQYGKANFFITDDNFGRNPEWETILNGLARLRKEGHQISFMIQADLVAYRQPGFVKKLAAAGCHQVFLGMETVNQESLKGVGKGQNHVSDYAKLCSALHDYGIAIHAAYMIGFPTDTPQSILEDIETIKGIGVDQASFFILTPIPGSEDHVRAFVDGVDMDPDFNNYDSFHAIIDHPHMSREMLRKMMFRSFKEFYRSRQMIDALKRLPDENFWGMFFNYLWYRNSALGEGTHPMMAGLWSKRNRQDIRPGYYESRLTFWRREAWFRLKYVGHLFREFYIFQHVYFETRGKAELAEHVANGLEKARGWWRHIFHRPSRNWLNAFWIRYAKQKWNLFWRWDWHFRMVPYAMAEVIYTFYFGLVMTKNFTAMVR